MIEKCAKIRPAMKRLCLLALLFATSAAAAEKPNVLFIAIDDLNDWVGVLGGHPQARTPNIDRLANRGVLFTHAYTAAPACNPSRAALMTGIAPYRSGVYLNSQDWRPALADADTLQQHFHDDGYWAAGSGKIYHGSFSGGTFWDEYWPSTDKVRPADPKPDGLPLNGISDTGHFDWGPVNAPVEEMGDYKVAAWITSQLERKHDKPFFLAFGVVKPHLPWYVPQKYFDQFPIESIELPTFNSDDLADVPAAGVRMAKPEGDHKNVVDHNQWRQAVQGYLASILFADEMVGKVLDALDRSSYADNTIIVLWTDHGWHLGEKSHWRKFALWEEATRTPLMFVVPKGIAPGLEAGTQAGQRVDTPVSLLDIYPTLVELCGLKTNNALMGESLTPLLADAHAKWERPALTTHGRLNHALRTPLYRYIRYADGSEELYDHRKDPYEWKNLARDPAYKAVIEGLLPWLPSEDAPDQPKVK